MNLFFALALLTAVCAAWEEPEPDYCEWAMWGPCSKTCGGGVQDRYRKCDGPYCNCGYDMNMESQSCNPQPCCSVTYQWEPWGKCRRCYQDRKFRCIKPPHCKEKCLTKKREKRKCDMNCQWRKTKKWGPCDVKKCIKYAKWKCDCTPKGCKGPCPGSAPMSSKPCNSDECCKCDWKHTGYSSCSNKYGRCGKQAQYSCDCSPYGCGSCSGKEPMKTEKCSESECCSCDWKHNGYSRCTLKYGKCVKDAQYSCDCSPYGCGSCSGKEPMKTEKCYESECCTCDWKHTGYSSCSNKYGKCEKEAQYSCDCSSPGCGSCGHKPSKTEKCSKSECCTCDWKHTGYSSCSNKHGKCEKQAEYSCSCSPDGCGSCGHKPSKTKTCPETECCDCKWKHTGYSRCSSKNGQCVKDAQYICDCTSYLCGMCKGSPTSMTEKCPPSDCCDCNWHEWGSCMKMGHKCTRKRICACPYDCKGDCDGSAYEDCYC